MAPLAAAFVSIHADMIAFGAETRAGIAAARLGEAGAAQGAAFGKGFGKAAGGLMVLGFGAGLGLLLAASTKAAGDFQAAMVRLTTSAGETGTRVSGNLKQVADGILAMAGPVGTSVTDLSKAMYTVESGSFHGAAGLKVLRAAAEGAKAENADLTKVTDAVTTALVDYHLSADQSALVTSKLVAATAAGKTTFEQLTGALHSVLPIASAAGIRLNDILGSLASMTLHGISAEQATQNLADVIRHMINPTALQAKELALLGMTTSQLSDDLKTKGLSGTLGEISDRIRKLMPPGSDKVILDLRTALSNLSPTVRALGIRMVEGTMTASDLKKEYLNLDVVSRAQLKSFAALAGTTHRIGDVQMTGSKTMQTYGQALARATGDSTGLAVALMLTGDNAGQTSTAIKMVTDATTEAGNHVAGWGVIQETFNFKLAALHANLGVVAVQLGTVLLPVVGKIATAISGVLGPMAAWIGAHGQLTAIIASSLAGLVALGTAAVVVTKLAAALRLMSATLGITAAAQWLLNAAVGTNVVITDAADVQIALYLVWSRLATAATWAFTAAQNGLKAAFLTSPWGWVVLAIAAVVAGVIYAYTHFKGFHDFIQKAWAWLKTAGIAVWDALKVAFHAVGDAVIWLWDHAIKPAWSGILTAFNALGVAARWVWDTGLKYLFAFWIAEFKTAGEIAMWLWHNAIGPAFNGIAAAAVWLWDHVIRPAFQAMVIIFRDVVAPVVLFLWHNVIEPFAAGAGRVLQAMWILIQIGWNVFVTNLTHVVIPLILWLWHNLFEPAWRGIATGAQQMWGLLKFIFKAWIDYINNNIIPPILWLWHNIFEPAFKGIGAAVKITWDNVVKPVFSAIAKFVTQDLPKAFSLGVQAITIAWDKVREAARVPVAFVVNQVINPMIRGFKVIASKFGVDTSGLTTISGYAEGGLIRGPGTGTSDSILAKVHDGPLIRVSNGEFVIPKRKVDEVGISTLNAWIGSPKVDMPGDGSQGVAFQFGGLIDFAKDVWGAVTDPAKLIKAPIEAAISHIPGAGLMRDMAAGAGRKLLDGLISWISKQFAALTAGSGGGWTGPVPAGVPAIQQWLWAQNGKPYVWASAGPGGYDCSGIVSAVYNLMHGRNPYSHTFSTSDEGRFMTQFGRGVLTAGWSNPGEPPASSSTGHTAGNLAGLPFESRGSVGVIVGSGARPFSAFAHIGHAPGMAAGGLIGVFNRDSGGLLPAGRSIVDNNTGRAEVMSHDGYAALVAEMVAVRHAIERVAPGVGRELNGTVSSMRQLARAR